MRKQLRHTLALLFMAALSGAMSVSCYVEDDSHCPRANQKLILQVYAPVTETMTRATDSPYNTGTGDDVYDQDEDRSNATASEKAVHSMKAWVFDSSDHSLIAFTDEKPEFSEVGVAEVEVEIMNNDVGKSADVYVIANAESVGLQALGEASTYAEVTAAYFGYKSATDDPFGTTTRTAAVDETKGLPQSGFTTSFLLDYDTDGVTLKKPEITLTRAVCKMEFVFSQNLGVQNMEILSITINGATIPQSEYIFPASATAPSANAHVYGTTYETANILLQNGDGTNPLFASTADATNGVAAIGSAYNVLNLRQGAVAADSDPNSYLARLNDSISANKATRYGLTYLRESDKKVTGTISYRYKSGEYVLSKVATFETKTDKEFTRNHSWIVYAYFLGGELFVNPTIADWIDTDPLDYILKMSTNMRLFDSWLYRYDTDADYDNWVGSHMAVSSGRETDGRPSRSPQIQLVTTGVDDYELSVDNDDFEIIRANKNDVGVVTSYEASTDGVLTISAGDDVYTYFYIVPKEGVTPANPACKVFLYYKDSVVGTQKVTFNNNSLPGYSDDSSEIWAYYFAPEDYNITGKLRMYYQDYSNPLVPTEVQN